MIAAADLDRAPLLRLADVRKSYALGTPAETEVLHGIDLTLDHREFVALIGPSGSGKSTLLNIIGLLDRPTAGRLFIHGRDTTTLSEDELTRTRGQTLGFVFQYHHLITAFSALENVMMPLVLQAGRANDAMAERSAGLLAQVGLTKWRDQKVGNLSGGQQQRVAIARALAMDPPLVLADEPTGNLDSASADAVFHLMREVAKARGTAFLIVTHNLELAARCDRIVTLADGRIVRDGAPAALSSA